MPLSQRPVQWALLSSIVIVSLVSCFLRGQPRVAEQPNLGFAGPAVEIDLNSAEPRELALLPGVGPVLAERIAADRQSNGPFESITDLDRVNGIGPKKLKELQSFCVVASLRESGGDRLLAEHSDSKPSESASR